MIVHAYMLEYNPSMLGDLIGAQCCSGGHDHGTIFVCVRSTVLIAKTRTNKIISQNWSVLLVT